MVAYLGHMQIFIDSKTRKSNPKFGGHINPRISLLPPLSLHLSHVLAALSFESIEYRIIIIIIITINMVADRVSNNNLQFSSDPQNWLYGQVFSGPVNPFDSCYEGYYIVDKSKTKQEEGKKKKKKFGSDIARFWGKIISRRRN